MTRSAHVEWLASIASFVRWRFDPDSSHPVPEEWRKPFEDMVQCFVDGDYRVSRLGNRVEPLGPETSKQISEYIGDYGETLVPLPPEVWDVAVAMWEGNDTLEVLVDLWTEAEGSSDLVLHAFVEQKADQPSIRIHLVYVP